ncbi:hypothetical protein BGZ81_008704 [Podila clonocystis]|nr:hypothetical protein BGZ81_008704 [Podila clonocystis]
MPSSTINQPSVMPSSSSTQRTRLSLLRLSLLLAITLSPLTLQAQAQGTTTARAPTPSILPPTTPPSVYQNISHAASSILADGGLYIYGGVIKFGDSLTGSKQFLRLDLTNSFSTDSPPWTTLQGSITFSMIDGVPSRNGKQMILAGNRDTNGPLAQIYDTETKSWTATPNLPGMNSMADYKRGNVGAALDRVTGLVYIYGGFPFQRFSKELSVLDTASGDASKMDWTLTVDQSLAPTLYEPFVTYLPTIKKTVVFGGCNAYNASSGYARVNNMDTYVMPSMAVIDTNTWTWKTEYKGASVDNIWTKPPDVVPNNPDVVPNNPDETPNVNDVASGGMSSGAKAGVGAGVVVALLAVGLGVFCWRRKKAVAQTVDANNKDLTKTKIGTEGMYSPGLVLRSRSDQNVTEGGLVSAQARHEIRTTGSETSNEMPSPISSEPLSAATTLPLYTSSTEQQQDQYTKGKPNDFKSTPLETDDAALAAALLQAEDHASHKPKNNPQYNNSSPTTPTTRYRQPHTQYISGPYYDQSKDDTSTMPTQLSGPQSVPDSEALIERSAPGVPAHVIHAHQLDQHGLYPPLTPARPHVASSSVMVGGPATYPVHSAGAGVMAMTGPRSPQLPYRDPQMLRDLDDIARIIQMDQEPKSPHTIVPPVDQWP